MSSSKESMSKGEEKKGNSENNPKVGTPKETSVERNSKGARPKTSSTLEKSIKETKEEAFLKVLIMNTSGPIDGDDSTPRRKLTIQDVINTSNPDLALVQEFKWKKIHGKIWSPEKFPEGYHVVPIPEHYQLTGNDETKIIYNTNELTVTQTNVNIQSILVELRRKSISQEFTPIPRMALRVVKTKGVPDMEFICISWHGEHTGKSLQAKVTDFKNLMIFLGEIYAKSQLPILIAGDFNVDITLIRNEVKYPFKICNYEASERRKEKGVIDYFITTTELNLSDITPVDLKKGSKAEKPEEVLDHDPVEGHLKPVQQSDIAPPLDEDSVTNGKRDDLIPSKELHCSSTTPVDLTKDLKGNEPEILVYDPLGAEIEPVSQSDTAPALDKDTVQISKKAN